MASLHSHIVASASKSMAFVSANRQSCAPGPSGRAFQQAPPCRQQTSLKLAPLPAQPHPRRASLLVASAGGEIVEVELLKGIRASIKGEGEDERPVVEYLVSWKDGSPDTWEPATNLADDLLRDFEQRWWSSVRKGDEEAVGTMLEGGKEVLARTVDNERRSALHFAAGLGRPSLVKMLLDAGAEVDLADREGYTPLHMASGYLHTSTIVALLEGGADPEQQDLKGRSPLELVESLRGALPAGNPATVARRVALEDVLKVLTDNLFEDVEPVAVLEARVPTPDDDEDGEEEEEKKKKAAAALASSTQEREFLVRFPDDEEPVWVPRKYVSDEVVEDFDAGLEYAEAEAVIGMRNRGDSRAYLVRWGDGYPDSWEPEEHVSPDLVKIFEEGQQGGGSAEGSNGGGSTTKQADPVAA